MGRRQIGLKFEESDVRLWDAWAAEHGLTRTTLIEAAVSMLMAADERVAESVVAEAKSGHLPRPGIRRVFVCLKCRRTTQLCGEIDPSFVPACSEHGKMVRQANHPYRGKSTEPPESWGWPPALDGVERRDEALTGAAKAS